MYVRMKRTIIEQLKAWKESLYRKPLILSGARQVGKTYILQEFGKQEYDHVAYINCDGNSEIANIFAEDYDMKRVLMVIGAISKQPIIPGKTLIILDEIQELHKGLSSLKYFCENAPEYHVAVAGSLLGVAMHQGESAPVGKVDIIRLYPMSFEEFLMAKDEEQLLNILKSKDWKTITLLHDKLIKILREYYFVGGMPEAVKTYLATNDANLVRQVQNNILTIYRSDMSKHVSPNEATRISMVWQSIPSQLAKENKKFQYSVVKKGSTSAKYAGSLQWIEDAGIITRCHNLSITELPLDGNAEEDTFKVYMCDTGLFVSMLEDGTQFDILQGDLYGYKGAIFENLIADIFTKMGRKLYYFHKDSGLEVEFVIRYQGECTLVEVKARSGNVKSTKTILDHPDKYHVSHAITLGDYNIGITGPLLPLRLSMAFLLRSC